VDTRKVPVGPGWASTPFPNLPDAATVNEVIGGVQQVVNEVAGNVREGLARTVSEIRTEAREDLRDARRTVRSENREARENLRDGISDAQAAVSDGASEVSDAAAQTRREAREDCATRHEKDNGFFRRGSCWMQRLDSRQRLMDTSLGCDQGQSSAAQGQRFRW
jgi:hypothetical protein